MIRPLCPACKRPLVLESEEEKRLAKNGQATLCAGCRWMTPQQRREAQRSERVPFASMASGRRYR